MSSWLSVASSQLVECWLVRQLAHELIECIPSPICVVRTPELTVALANHSMRELLGDASVTGLTLRSLPYPCAEWLCRAFDGASGPKDPRPSVVHAVDTDGRELERFYDWTLCPLRSSDWTAAVGHDVTLHIEARRKLEQANHRSEETRRKNDDFVAQIAHELRNPLASIGAAVEVLRAPESLDPTRALMVLERQTKSLARLVDDLVDRARQQRNKLALSRECVALARIIDQAVDVAAPLLSAHRHGLDIDLADDLLVDGDPGRLTQVLCNLVTNAAKYTADGGSIQIAGRRVDGEVVVSIRDSGIGITPEMLPRVFDRFVRAPGAEERSEGGLGLGLHIVRMLVREHGGRVEAQSDGVGRGSTFTVRLPAPRATQSDA